MDLASQDAKWAAGAHFGASGDRRSIPPGGARVADSFRWSMTSRRSTCTASCATPFGAVGRSGSAAIGAGRTGLAWMVNSIGAFVRELPRSERWVIWTNRCSLVDNAGIARYVP